MTAVDPWVGTPSRWSMRSVAASDRRSTSSTPRWPPSTRRTSTRSVTSTSTRARAAAESADVWLPFGGVPLPIKLGTPVAGWPNSQASIPLKDREFGFDATIVTRLREAGAVLFGQTTMSEFAGLNHTRTRLHGITRNPWERRPHAGWIVRRCGRGGRRAACHDRDRRRRRGFDPHPGRVLRARPGSRRPTGGSRKAPRPCSSNLTAVSGCLARSVRDIARYLDVVNGFDHRDPSACRASTAGRHGSARTSTSSAACGWR